MQEQNLLTPGAIWSRTDDKGNGRRATVLLVANRHLSDKVAKKFPPMVIYLDDRGRVNAVGEERFTETREFWDMDDQIVNRVAALLSNDDEDDTPLAVVEDTPTETPTARASQVVAGVPAPKGDMLSFGDDDDEDHAPLPPAAEVLADPAVVATAVEYAAPVRDEPVSPADVDALPHPQIDAVFMSSADGTYPPVDPELLENNVVQYEQEPHLTEEGLTLRHKIHVFLAPGLTVDTLNASFNPEGAVYYNAFKINGIVVNWNSYLGAWPLIAPDGMYAALTFTTNVAEEAPAVTEEQAAQNEERMMAALAAANKPQEEPVVLEGNVTLTEGEVRDTAAELAAFQATQIHAPAEPVQVTPAPAAPQPQVGTLTAAPAQQPLNQQRPITPQQPTVMQGAFQAAGIQPPQQAEVLDLVGRNVLNVQPAQ